jgi:predicted GNAT family acetyltransferase
MDGMPDITVSRNDSKHRYEAHLHGRRVGFSQFRMAPGQVTFTHTEVDDEVEGQGIGSTLARRALDDVRARGEKVVAECPFIKEYIERHPAYADLLA